MTRSSREIEIQKMKGKKQETGCECGVDSRVGMTVASRSVLRFGTVD